MGLSKHLESLLDTITEKQARLASLRPLDLLLVQKIKENFRIEYNYHSNHIEGNSLTLQETRSLLTTQIITSDKPKKLRDYNEMNGHDKALSYLGLIDKLSYTEQTIKSEKLLISEKLIKEIHQMILIEDYKKQVRDESGNLHYVDVKVGEYKSKENHVQRLSDGTIWQFASVLDTPLRIRDLIQRFDTHQHIYHPIVLASLFHYKFIRIHPFDDGNGRTARLLMNMILMYYGYPLAIISSDVDQRNYYYNALELTDARLPLLNQVFEPNNLPDYEVFIQFIGKSMMKSFDMIEEIVG